MSITHLFPQVDGVPRLAEFHDVIMYWPQIRAALREIRKEQGPRATWTSEHVLSAIRAGQAELWLMIAKDSSFDAFVITQTVIDPCLHVPTGLFVWFLWRAPHTPKHILIDAMDSFFSQLARDRGLLYLEAISTFPRFVASMETRGWETVGFVIRRQLEEQ